MIERGEQADVLRQQHAVAEHVARHVADADAGEILGLAIAAERAEMALDRFPGAFRGDAHALVVVADRAARGERVAEPVIVLARDRVGDIRERRRALVGGDDEIRIVAVVAHAVLRMHDLAFDEIVGDVEQAVDEQAVAGHAFGELRIAVAGDRRTLDEEAALGTDRHDDRVLDHLRLDQAEHFGAEILAPIRPAQAAARDRAEAQMHAFDARRIDEDLAIRARLGQVRHACAGSNLKLMYSRGLPPGVWK